MRRRAAPEPVTPAGIERALALCANLVVRDKEGLQLVPIMNRLEVELARARATCIEISSGAAGTRASMTLDDIHAGMLAAISAGTLTALVLVMWPWLPSRAGARGAT